MSESIGGVYTTQVPSLSDPANIQEALRLYHYGAPTGTGVGQYDINNTDPASLVNPSIAYSLNSLQSQVTALSFTTSLPTSAYNAKGVIIVGTGVGTYAAQTVGTNGTVLTANSVQADGVEWVTPAVTLTNSATLTNKTLTSPVINIGFSQQAGTSYTLVLSDNSKMVEFSSSSSVSVIVPRNVTAAIPVGAQISLLRVGSGQVTVVPEDGTVSVFSGLGLKLRAQWSGAVLTKRATNIWVLNGDTSI
jgi:hypothetical protein